MQYLDLNQLYAFWNYERARLPTLLMPFKAHAYKQSLDTKVEKNSPSLGRQAIYSQKSRVSRLPTYLTVHMVRFAWRADIGKKAKIMVRPSTA